MKWVREIVSCECAKERKRESAHYPLKDSILQAMGRHRHWHSQTQIYVLLLHDVVDISYNFEKKKKNLSFLGWNQFMNYLNSNSVH